MCIAFLTIFGYGVIHRVGRVASVLGIIAFAYLFTRLMTVNDIGLLLTRRGDMVAGTGAGSACM